MSDYVDHLKQHSNKHVRVALQSLEKIQEWWSEESQVPAELKSQVEEVSARIKNLDKHYSRMSSKCETLKVENTTLMQDSDEKNQGLLVAAKRHSDKKKMIVIHHYCQLSLKEREVAEMTKRVAQYKGTISTAKGLRARVRHVQGKMVDWLNKALIENERVTEIIRDRHDERLHWRAREKTARKTFTEVKLEMEQVKNDFLSKKNKLTTDIEMLKNEGDEAQQSIENLELNLDNLKNHGKNLMAQSKKNKSNLKVAQIEIKELESRKIYLQMECARRSSIIANEEFQHNELIRRLKVAEQIAANEQAVLEEQEQMLSEDAIPLAESLREIEKFETQAMQTEESRQMVQNKKNEKKVRLIKKEILLIEARCNRKAEQVQLLREKFPNLHGALGFEIRKLRSRLSEVQETALVEGEKIMQAMTVRQKAQQERSKLSQEMEQKLQFHKKVLSLLTERVIFLRDRGSSLAVTASEMAFLLGKEKEELEVAQDELTKSIRDQRQHSLQLASTITQLNEEEEAARMQMFKEIHIMTNVLNELMEKEQTLTEWKMKVAHAKRVLNSITEEVDKLIIEDSTKTSKARILRKRAADQLSQWKQLEQCREVRNEYRAEQRDGLEPQLLDLMRKVSCIQQRNKRFVEETEKLEKRLKAWTTWEKERKERRMLVSDEEQELRYTIHDNAIFQYIVKFLYDLAADSYGANEMSAHIMQRRAILHHTHQLMCNINRYYGDIVYNRQSQLGDIQYSRNGTSE